MASHPLICVTPVRMYGANAVWSAARAKAAHSLGPHQHRPGPGGVQLLALQCHFMHRKVMSSRHIQIGEWSCSREVAKEVHVTVLQTYCVMMQSAGTRSSRAVNLPGLSWCCRLCLGQR